MAADDETGFGTTIYRPHATESMRFEASLESLWNEVRFCFSGRHPPGAISRAVLPEPIHVFSR